VENRVLRGHYSHRSVIAGYLTVSVLFTLAASLIWAINTIFLIREGGLNIFQVMIVNSVFTVGQMVFEVPTGVVADTIGRRASLLFAMLTLIIATVAYVLTPSLGLGIWGFIGASAILGLGFTFQTGTTEAWLVDALDATGWERPKERVFAWGQMASGCGMLVGSLLGGILGQLDLAWPYIVRAVLLAVAFVAVLVMVHDLGFTPRPLRWSTFGEETRKILLAGTTFGWRSPVVRPLLWASALGGVFFMYGFYAWQPYVLDLLGRDYVWLLGVVQAVFSLTGILGNALVGRIMREGARRREAPRVLALAAGAQGMLAWGIAMIGLVFAGPGFLPAGLAIGLWLVWGMVFGIATPIRMSYINEHIPSAQRATVLSLDAFFADAGGTVGQPALGWLSERASIPVAWLVGGTFIAATSFLYRTSGRAARKEEARHPARDTGAQ
jgi:MFS family permease